MSDWIRRLADGIELEVKVTPRADGSALAGTVRDAFGRTRLAVRLANAPVDGAANRALLRLLAETLDRPKSACRLLAGGTARIKRVRVLGDPMALETRVRALAGDGRP